METVVAVLFIALAGAVALLVILWLLATALTGLGTAFEILVALLTGKPLDEHLKR